MHKFEIKRSRVVLGCLIVVALNSLPMVYGLTMGCIRASISEASEAVRFHHAHLERADRIRNVPLLGSWFHTLQGAGYQAALNVFGADDHDIQKAHR
ncbi:MAG: hypothetical protein AB7F75_04860 [Planctomycetota bacterium]